MHTLRYGPKMKLVINTEQKEVENHQGIELYKMSPVILATENENKTEQFVNNWYEECEKQLKTQADEDTTEQLAAIPPSPPVILAKEEQ